MGFGDFLSSAGGGSIVGGLVSAGASLLGGRQNRSYGQDMFAQNAALQREFAQKGIQWKVKDAQQAGVHPLYALGANTHSFSPVSVGNVDSGLSDAGQHIGRAIEAGMDRPTKTQARLNDLKIERGELENQLLRSQIALAEQPATPPPIPDAFPVRRGILAQPLAPPKYDEFGNRVFFGTGGMHRESSSLTPIEDISMYFGEIPGELQGAGDFFDRTVGKDIRDRWTYLQDRKNRRDERTWRWLKRQFGY